MARPEDEAAGGDLDAVAAYRALRARGLDHRQVVERLARDVAEVLRQRQQERALRGER